MIKELKPEQLKREVNVKEIEELLKSAPSEKPVELVGQGRAWQALQLHLLEEGHMVVITENSSPEFIEFLKKDLQKKTEGMIISEEAKKDKVYVHNFDDFKSPRLLYFPAGEGKTFQDGLDKLYNQLLEEVPSAVLTKKHIEFEDKLFPDYRKKMNEILENYEKNVIKKEKVREDLEKNGLRVKVVPDVGFEFRIYDSERDEEIRINDVSSPMRSQLAQQIDIRIGKSKWARKIKRSLGRISRKLLSDLNQELRKIETKEIRRLTNSIFKEILTAYRNNPDVIQFLIKLREYSIGPLSPFMPFPTKIVLGEKGLQPEKDELRHQRMLERVLEKVGVSQVNIPFEANPIVSHLGQVPVLTELTPTHASLFGRAEREIRAGFEIASDHTKIRPGKLHEANGGYLILDLNEVYQRHISILSGLKRVLKEKELRIVDELEELGISSGGKRLTPEPMPLNCKVIVVVRPIYYYISWMIPLLQDLIKCFPIRAEFDTTIEFNSENILGIITGLRKWAEQKECLEANSKAFARILEELIVQGCDLVHGERGTQDRLYANLKPIQKIYQEADFYAKRDNSQIIEESHLKRAIASKTFRGNLIEEQERRQREKGIILIHTQGVKRGEINALAVGPIGDVWLGVVDRVTATARRVHSHEIGGVDINPDKSGGFAGGMYRKATETIKSFLEEQFGDKELYYKSTISFEQIYRVIDGPSASLAEMLSVYSAISEVPLRQDLAITGTMDQEGRAGAIGGVNHKIRAFFDTCQMEERELTGTQGVVIPATNAQQLMLEDRIIDKIRERRFHIYTVEGIEDAIELFTGKKYSEIQDLVDQKFTKWQPESLRLEQERLELERQKLSAAQKKSFWQKVKNVFKGK